MFYQDSNMFYFLQQQLFLKNQFSSFSSSWFKNDCIVQQQCLGQNYNLSGLSESSLNFCVSSNLEIVVNHQSLFMNHCFFVLIKVGLEQFCNFRGLFLIGSLKVDLYCLCDFTFCLIVVVDKGILLGFIGLLLKQQKIDILFLNCLLKQKVFYNVNEVFKRPYQKF